MRVLASDTYIDHVVIKHEPMPVTLDNCNVVTTVECAAAVYDDRH